jgi:plastocyanin
MSPVRSLSAVALGALVIVGLVACSAAAQASAAPASAGASSGASSGTTVLPLVAKNVQFATLTLEAPAGRAFQIAFDNQDASIQHNVQIADGAGTKVFEGPLVTGVAQATYDVGALPAGAYKFSCRIHPAMVGDLTVK